MESIEIRQFDEPDRTAIETIAEQIVQQGDVFPFESVAGVMDYWFSPGSLPYIGVLDGQVAGSYVIKPNQPDRCGHIANAGYMVDSRFRRRGIGRALAEHSLCEARRLGYRGMQFNIVVATNTAAVALWHQMGFDIVGTIPRGFRLPGGELSDLLIMYRDL